MSDFTITFRKEIYTQKYLQTLNLTERQIKAILFIKEKGKITNADYQKLNDCSRNTATNELKDLEKSEIVQSSRLKGAGAFYILNE